MYAANVVELRKNERLSPADFYALVGDEAVHVDNISVAGICIDRPEQEFPGKNVCFWIVPLFQGFLDESRAVEVNGHIVGQSNDKIRIVFSTVNHDLSNMIQSYLGAQRA
jgi:hypothetical protein